MARPSSDRTSAECSPGMVRPFIRGPLATQAEIADEPPPFPSTTNDLPCETPFVDWRDRLTRNLSRRSDSRWDPLTCIHGERK
jgi:hypothetical protein